MFEVMNMNLLSYRYAILRYRLHIFTVFIVTYSQIKIAFMFPFFFCETQPRFVSAFKLCFVLGILLSRSQLYFFPIYAQCRIQKTSEPRMVFKSIFFSKSCMMQNSKMKKNHKYCSSFKANFVQGPWEP